MKARRYAVQITGETPLLMHPHNLAWIGQMERWLKDPENKKLTVAGDDRTPAWKWIGCLYNEGGKVTMPSDNLMTLLREGGSKCPTGKKGGTFKRQTQSGLVVDQSAWPLVVNGKEIPIEPFKALIGNNEFGDHEALAMSHGFELFQKGVKIGPSRHIRVRPRFDQWSCSGSITVFDETITGAILEQILFYGGAQAGLGDWRPSSPKAPGPYGKFTSSIKEI